MNSQGQSFRHEDGKRFREQEGTAARAPVSFDSPEQALQRDRQETPVPAEIVQRLGASLAREPAPKVSWWKRWMGRGRETGGKGGGKGG